MSRKYTTKINLKKRKKRIKDNSRFIKKNKRNYLSFGSTRISNPLSKISKARREKIKKAMAIVMGVFFIILLSSFIIFMRYLQSITSELPSPDAPFGLKDQASVIYASNQTADDEYEQLYKVFGDENRDSIDIEEVPEHVKWAFLAAEDVDFYSHPGFDVGGVIKAGMHEVFGIGSPRGGSTITQQLIKQTALSDERTYERKLKEIIMSLQVERLYGKDEILEMYLNVIPFGSNVYGLKTASKFYYDKDVSELTLAEAAVLARIPQNPVYNSPTLSPDPEDGQQRALNGRDYVLGQMEANLNKINDQIISDDEIILVEEIEEAFATEMVYSEPRIDIAAPHFVFYVQKLLTTGEYNNGEPFELQEIQKGGYRVYTSLDMDIQRIAEEEVAGGVSNIAASYGARNGAAIITSPSTGDILAMVGSKSYNAKSEGTLFDGKVNVTDTLQSMGSSMKPFAYYKAFEMGISSPGSYIPDVPIQIGNYKPRNYDGRFLGVDEGYPGTARYNLQKSRNIPILALTDAVGVSTMVDTYAEFGYESIERDRDRWGHAVVLGGADVTMVEHSEAYGVLANGGDKVDVNPILKITKYNPDTDEEELVYEREIEKEAVADQRAVYMVNHIQNYKNGGPPLEGIDGRDYAGKTGTTQDVRDTVFSAYTPDFVVIGWNGNNDNSPMSLRATGVSTTRPWVISLSKRIAGKFPEKTPFTRPGGLVSGNACDQNEDSSEGLECGETGGDLMIANKRPPAYRFKKVFRVCVDQKANLAREIDENVGKAIDKEFYIYKMPSPSLQSFLDKAVSNKLPTEYCTVDRSPNQGNPWAQFNSPGNGSTITGSTLDVSLKAFSVSGYPTNMELFLNGNLLDTSTTLPDYTGSFNISGYEPGTYTLRARVYDSTGLYGDSSVQISIGGNNPNLNVTGSTTGTQSVPMNISYSYSGASTLNSVTLFIQDPTGSIEQQVNLSGAYTWTPAVIGEYSLYIEATTITGATFRSNIFLVNVSN